MAVSFNKKKKKSTPKIESDTSSITGLFLGSTLGRVGLVIVGLILFIVACSILWQQFGSVFFQPGVQVEDITVTPRPRWIFIDVKEEAHAILLSASFTAETQRALIGTREDFLCESAGYRVCVHTQCLYDSDP